MTYSLKDLAMDTIKGNVELVDNDTYLKRKSICNGCEFNRLKTCTRCGCVIEFKVKLIKSTCPDSKW